MLMKTRKLMTDYAESLPPSSERAQCRHIAALELATGESIAERLRRDHSSLPDALRAARLMVHAGAAAEQPARPSCYGRYSFEDGSTL